MKARDNRVLSVLAIVLVLGCQPKNMLTVQDDQDDKDTCGAAHEELRHLRSKIQRYEEWEGVTPPRADIWHDRRRVIDGRFLACRELSTDQKLLLSCQVLPE